MAETRMARDGTPGTVVEYVISENLERRHLNPGQRAMLGAELISIFERQAETRSRKNLRNAEELSTSPAGDVGKSTEKAAQVVGSFPRTVQRAKRVKDQAPPEVSRKVKDGTMTLGAAERLLRDSPAVLDLEGRRVPDHLRSLFDDSIPDHAAGLQGPRQCYCGSQEARWQSGR
jgi:hypothetical protein